MAGITSALLIGTSIFMSEKEGLSSERTGFWRRTGEKNPVVCCPRSIRNSQGGIPAVVVTAFHEDYPLAEVCGWAAYFQKSVDMNQFVETVATILKVPRDPGLFS
jgi:hypothetical protein